MFWTTSGIVFTSMMKLIIMNIKKFTLIIIFLHSIGFTQIIDTIGSTTVHIDSIWGPPAFDYSRQPWDLHWGKDNRLWFTLGNNICVYDTTAHTIDTVYKNRHGLYDATYSAYKNNAMGVATHPDFPATNIVYATYDTSNYYYQGGNWIVLYKFLYSSSGDSLYNPTPILKWWHPGEHSGGRIMVSSDNYLYVTTAEHWDSWDTGSTHYSGKILRVNLDGGIPAANVSGDHVFTKGHRNPQGIVELPNGNIMVSELGQIIDELNLIEEGKHYGWICYDGPMYLGADALCDTNSLTYTFPIDTAYRPPSGISYYSSNAIPELNGCVLQSILSFGGHQGGLVASKMNATFDDVVSDVHYFRGDPRFLRWRDVEPTPDGKLFAITNDRIQARIRLISNPDHNYAIDEFENKFAIFPNPVGNFIQINSNFNDIIYYQIIDFFGKKIVESSTKFKEINVQNLASGIYFLKINTTIHKFIKL